MQDADFQWFLEKYNELFAKYGNSFLVIKNKNVLGVYKTYAEGVENTLRNEEIGTFIVQQCSSNKAASTNSSVASINF